MTRQDAGFYALESTNNPMYLGLLVVLDNAAGVLDRARLAELVQRRLALTPRYRCRIREVPFGLGRPVWVPDDAFDVDYHVVRIELAGAAGDGRLRLFDLVGELAARPLRRDRPLWRIYLVDDLPDGRSAVFVKSHAALVDADTGADLGHVILDPGRTARSVAARPWEPGRAPGDVELVLDALGRLARRPQAGMEFALRKATDAAAAAGDSAAAAVRAAFGGGAGAGLNGPTSSQRRFAATYTRLADYRTIQDRTGAGLDDAVLAVIAGALRGWMFSRGVVLTQSSAVRVLAPTTVRDDGTPDAAVTSMLVDLPVGEADPVMRLSHIRHARDVNSGVEDIPNAPERTLVNLAGFAPAGLHALGIRAASRFAQHTYNLVITNAPGPSRSMNIAGARMLEMYPVLPLLRNQTLSIGVTSCHGKVCHGLTADRAAAGDVDVLTRELDKAMEEMLDACR
ncbi:MAG: wax ester/triacylglycerol synthase family O-acyltransferase [Mycobacteriaceae bacterium]|nr:wax ester/triacylglycerol synthase family O-acyltransferase [Mycobacteriaceae bacterium]